MEVNKSYPIFKITCPVYPKYLISLAGEKPKETVESYYPNAILVPVNDIAQAKICVQKWSKEDTPVFYFDITPRQANLICNLTFYKDRSFLFDFKDPKTKQNKCVSIPNYEESEVFLYLNNMVLNQASQAKFKKKYNYKVNFSKYPNYSPIVQGSNPQEAFTDFFVNIKLTPVKTKEEADVCMSLLDGEKESISYYKSKVRIKGTPCTVCAGDKGFSVKVKSNLSHFEKRDECETFIKLNDLKITGKGL